MDVDDRKHIYKNTALGGALSGWKFRHINNTTWRHWHIIETEQMRNILNIRTVMGRTSFEVL